jgi:hypothetical protein
MNENNLAMEKMPSCEDKPSPSQLGSIWLKIMRENPNMKILLTTDGGKGMSSLAQIENW